MSHVRILCNACYCIYGLIPSTFDFSFIICYLLVIVSVPSVSLISTAEPLTVCLAVCATFPGWYMRLEKNNTAVLAVTERAARPHTLPCVCCRQQQQPGLLRVASAASFCIGLFATNLVNRRSWRSPHHGGVTKPLSARLQLKAALSAAL